MDIREIPINTIKVNSRDLGEELHKTSFSAQEYL